MSGGMGDSGPFWFGPWLACHPRDHVQSSTQCSKDSRRHEPLVI
jgi:hypothetical protein